MKAEYKVSDLQKRFDKKNEESVYRICIYVDVWASGGIESFLTNIILHLVKNHTNLDIDIVASCVRESVFTNKLEAIGVKFYALSGGKYNILQQRKKFKWILKTYHYDVVYLNLFQGVSLYYAHIAKKSGVHMVIAHSHNSALRKSFFRTIKLCMHKFCIKKYVAEVDRFLACSKAAAEFMFTKKGVEMCGYTFIPNGIDLERYRFDAEGRIKVRNDLGIGDKFVIGNVGRLCYQKNQNFLLDVFAEVCKYRKDALLLLVGEGPDEDFLREKAIKLGIEDFVFFYGVTSQVEQLYWAMDCFAFPSWFEGLGIVMIEAQASGLPIICSENIPNEAILTDNCVRLGVGKTKEWASEILRIRNINESRSENIESGVLWEYDINSAAEKVFDELGTRDKSGIRSGGSRG